MNYAEKYLDAYQGSLAWIPEVTIALQARADTLKDLINNDRFLIVTTNYSDQLQAISFLKAANVMKEAVEVDDIDDINQNKKAFQCMDAYTGLLEEMGISEEEFLTGAI